MFQSIRHSLQFYRDPVSFLSKLQHTHGDYHVERLGFQTVHFVFDPELARAILKDPLTFIKTRHVYNKIKPITGNTGLVQIEGEEGLKLRKVFNQFFQQDAIDCYLAGAREIVGLTKDQFEGKGDVRARATGLVLQTAISMFAGVSSTTDTVSLSRCFLELNALCAKQFKNLLPLQNPFRSKKIRAAQRNLDSTIIELVKETHHDCLIQRIREAGAELPVEITDTFLLNQVKTFLFAGHETTATYLIMALYELAKDQELQQQIHEDCVLNEPGKTTSGFLKEILRLYSPAWMMVRESTAAGEIREHRYKTGDFFFLGIHQIHRHSGHWDQPENLIPSRHEQNNAAFLPYGHGKRHCIGARLADLELTMILQLFLKEYRLEYRGDRDTIRPEVMITAYPADPVEIAFLRRS